MATSIVDGIEDILQDDRPSLLNTSLSGRIRHSERNGTGLAGEFFGGRIPALRVRIPSASIISMLHLIVPVVGDFLTP
jgi:hypothetical protein